MYIVSMLFQLFITEKADKKYRFLARRRVPARNGAHISETCPTFQTTTSIGPNILHVTLYIYRCDW
jgi:hypothetical protein